MKEGQHEVDKNLILYYNSVMNDIKNRSEVIYDVHKKSEFNKEKDLKHLEFITGHLLTDIELGSVQLRKILELILISSLVANKKEYERLSIDIDRNWIYKRKLNEIKKLNPNYFPERLFYIYSDSTRAIDKPYITTLSNDKMLNEEELYEAHSFASMYLHAQSPFKPQLTYENVQEFYHKLKEYIDKIMNLLTYHRVILCDGNMIKCDIYNINIITNKMGIETTFLKYNRPIK